MAAATRWPDIDHEPSDAELVATAQSLVGEYALIKPKLTAGAVASALVTARGNVYTGINLDLACGIGFCAEHSAVADMLKARETTITRIVAVDDKRIVPPCGRCRELLVQVDRRNIDCIVLLPGLERTTLRELLPKAWLEHLFVSE